MSDPTFYAEAFSTNLAKWYSQLAPLTRLLGVVEYVTFQISISYCQLNWHSALTFQVHLWPAYFRFFKITYARLEPWTFAVWNKTPSSGWFSSKRLDWQVISTSGKGRMPKTLTWTTPLKKGIRQNSEEVVISDCCFGHKMWSVLDAAHMKGCFCKNRNCKSWLCHAYRN